MRAHSIAVFAALSLFAVTASAQDARELFQQGQAAYETGDYAQAAELWERAYEADPRPLLQHNLAQAYERLGQLDRAVTAYEIYLDATPGDDPRVVTARARLASLRERLGNTGIVLSGGPEGATILVDGEDRGRLPHPDPLRVEPGSHQIVVRHDGYQDFTSVVAVSAGQAAEVPITMQAGDSGGATASGDGDGLGISMIGVGIAAGGAAVLVGGAITGGLALAAAGDAPNGDGPEADDARTLALVTDILIPAGAVIAATGVVLMFVLDDGSPDTARVVPVVGPDYAGVTANGTF